VRECYGNSDCLAVTAGRGARLLDSGAAGDEGKSDGCFAVRMSARRQSLHSILPRSRSNRAVVPSVPGKSIA
jgi:hypothetical protein